MNIATIYKEMESKDSLNLAVYLGYLQEHINSPAFSLDEIVNKDKKFLRALACAAMDIKKPKMFFNLITTDSQMKVFTSHMALIKCSAELLNLSNSIEDLEVLLENVIDGVRHAKVTTPGTTLSFAFGFVLGTGIKRGVNVTSFFKKLDSKFIVDNDKLFNGLFAALKTESTILVLNNKYITDITERYDNWEERSRILSLRIFKYISIDKFSGVSVNEYNVKVLDYFSGRGTSYNTFLSDYHKKINFFNVSQQTDNTKQNSVETSYDNNKINNSQNSVKNTVINQNENNSLKKTVQKQEQTIFSLQNEISLYKSLLTQFNPLFPDLEKILKISSNDQDLLIKIYDLVNEQKTNITNLKNYFEEGEKQKAIKDGFKKRL